MNRQNFLFEQEAKKIISNLVPKYAKSAIIKKDDSGYWLNVSWNCGITAALTIQETYQSLGETNA